MVKTSKVRLTSHPETNEIITQGENGWYRARVEQTSFSMSGGIVNKSSRSALIQNQDENTLKEYLQYLGLNKAGDTVEGYIFVNEQTEPMWEGQVNKTTGGDNPIDLLKGDELIYRTTYFVPADQITEDDQDHFIQHTNVDEVREAARQRVNAMDEAA